jgi:hypothetical protein
MSSPYRGKDGGGRRREEEGGGKGLLSFRLSKEAEAHPLPHRQF